MRVSRDINSERIGEVRPVERHLDPWGTGNPAQDGFDRIERRPRVPGAMAPDAVGLDRAGRIEEFVRPIAIDED